MAELPAPVVVFDDGCPDCGQRQADLPLPIPRLDDDFDWLARDYDSFRLFMMQELASRAPDRARWTPADMEVVIVEVLAAALDRLSHAVDRVQGERFLDSARRPGSLRRLLALIGYDPLPQIAAALAKRPTTRIVKALEILNKQLTAQNIKAYWHDNPTEMDRDIAAYWAANPVEMERARREGPLAIGQQRRMVTLDDYATTLTAHPLVALARAGLVWTGSWQTILVSTVQTNDYGLDDVLILGAEDTDDNGISDDLWSQVQAHHSALDLPLADIATTRVTARRVLRPLIDAYRMIGTEVFLEAAKPAPVAILLSVRAKPGYFRTEMQQALAQVFASERGGYFEPGRHGFGKALFASDIIEAAMRVEGVAVACLNGFRRLGRGFSDSTRDGVIEIADDEYIRCLNERGNPDGGRIEISVNGGELG